MLSSQAHGRGTLRFGTISPQRAVMRHAQLDWPLLIGDSRVITPSATPTTMASLASLTGDERLVPGALCEKLCWLNKKHNRQSLEIVQAHVQLVAVLDLVDFHQGPVEMFRQFSSGYSALFPIPPYVAGKQAWYFGMPQSRRLQRPSPRDQTATGAHQSVSILRNSRQRRTL
jgi:hypothetical protein